MKNFKRVFVIVLDSFGIGFSPDAKEFGDEGANTLRSLQRSGSLAIPHLLSMGLGNIEGVEGLPKEKEPSAAYGRLREVSAGKDTTVGHWELSGLVSRRALPTYPNGFPEEILEEFSRKTGRGVLCNKPYSGTQVIEDFAEEQKQSGKWIVYTSADSVFQIAAHEEWIPLEELYRACEIVREILKGEHSVGRVIARPYLGEKGNYRRTANRHDYSLIPPEKTMLDLIVQSGKEVLSVGKIVDIFAGRGITDFVRTKGNRDGCEKTIAMQKRDFTGLCFTNLVDFDSLYGHRNDARGYAEALNEFDAFLPSFLEKMQEGDLLFLTADHGCDPGFPTTDHTREFVPILACGKRVRGGIDLGTRKSFADLSATVLCALGIEEKLCGESFLKQIIK